MEPGRGEIDDQPILEVDVSALSATDSPRSSGEDAEHVQALAAADTELPPIIVHRATMRVIDGMHRLRVAKIRGQKRIAVRFYEGDEANAFVLAVKANVTHGLPLSLADRKRAAGRITLSHPEWSDRMVAAVTGLSGGTVAEIRQRVAGKPSATSIRIGQDGRVRPLDRTKGRLLASELISEDPTLSLREISRAAGISPETARDVRNRLRRGEDPLPNGRKTPKDLVTELRPSQEWSQQSAAIVERLKADPALRFSETGRNLLRLLTVATLRAEEWDEIIENVPPHCSSIVAQLAKVCAGVWEEIAARTERRAADAACTV
ncbi:ParB N-terminal domain-containing protein [Streptomyces sp. B6B3]|uniref:ParB/RepB/Spo0J family partition protein n=1 Tax=Streptomyces sp. B6B3 TaxID=3153570 RepID=UPI00325E4160